MEMLQILLYYKQPAMKEIKIKFFMEKKTQNFWARRRRLWMIFLVGPHLRASIT
jgi:hypothetical protein